MARIIISSMGTLGDFVPFFALGGRLQALGHDVVLAVNPAFMHHAERARLATVPCGDSYGPAEAGREAEFYDDWTRTSEEDERRFWHDMGVERHYHDLKAACAGADLLIASSLQYAAVLVHEVTGIPWITVTLQPCEFAHEGASVAGEQPETVPVDRYPENQLRARLGLPMVSGRQWWGAFRSRRLILLASSLHYSQPVLTRYPQARMTGFWWHDQAAQDWSPPPELAEFLAAQPPALVLTLGSLPLRDPAPVVAVHAEAAVRLQRRLVIQRGWAGLDRHCLPASLSSAPVCFTDWGPSAWLFARAAAVIHHGGLGTTSQALRCGCPTVVEPYGNDQFFNAQRVRALGVGTAMNPHKLTPDGLTRALTERVLIPSVQERSRELAGLLQSEDGLTTACELIEAELARGS